MHRVNISDLKAKLSAHIQMVRDGEEVLVCDRNRPVARIVPVSVDEQSQHERGMIARGELTPPTRRKRSSTRWPKPPGNISDEVMQRIWREERDSR